MFFTRADPEQVTASLEAAPEGEVVTTGPLATVCWRPAPDRTGRVVVVTAGTADLPVAEECRAVLRAFGFAPVLVADCGVAGVHRLLASADDVAGADAVVVVAGMEGERSPAWWPGSRLRRW